MARAKYWRAARIRRRAASADLVKISPCPKCPESGEFRALYTISKFTCAILLAPFPLWRPVVPFSVALLRCISLPLARTNNSRRILAHSHLEIVLDFKKMLLNFNNFLFSEVDTTKNVCYNDGEPGKAHAAAPKEFAAKGRRLCVDISHSRRSKTLDCAMLRGHSPFAD